MMASYLHIGTLLAALTGAIAVPAGSAGVTPADLLMREPHAAMMAFNPGGALAERDGRDLLCAVMWGRTTGQSGSTPASGHMAGGGAANNAGYVAMHRHATQSHPFAWELVQTCAVQ